MKNSKKFLAKALFVIILASGVGYSTAVATHENKPQIEDTSILEYNKQIVTGKTTQIDELCVENCEEDQSEYQDVPGSISKFFDKIKEFYFRTFQKIKKIFTREK